MRYVISGAAGFIGTHLCRRLLADGHEVVGIDKDFHAIMRLEAALPKIERVPAVLGMDGWNRDWNLGCNLRSAADIAGGCWHCDGVFHLASTVGVFNVLTNPRETIRNILDSTAQMAGLCAEHDVPLLLTSSSEAYGLGKPDGSPLAETDNCTFGPSSDARWCYGIAKLAAEHVVLDHHRTSGLPAVIVRLFNTVGPGQSGDGGMVVPRFVKAALAGESLRVFGDGQQVRTFCHVLDTVECLVRLMGRVREFSGDVFNVGSARPRTIGALARSVIDTLGSSSTVCHVPYDKAYPQGGFAEIPCRIPNVSKVYDAIEWQSTRPLNEVIRDVAIEIERKEREAAA